MRTRRGLLATSVLLVGIALAAPTATADPVVVPVDVEGEACTEFVPHVLGPTTTPVRLDVRVLLDGATQADAAAAVGAMRVAYSPLGISVRATYQNVVFSTTDADELNQAAKHLLGGRRPRGVDVVYTLTTKDIGGGAYGDAVAGLADCIGGVRYPDRAFAVGEVFADDSGISQATGKTMAHEIGHLLGGHHHWASAEGVAAADPNALTLMGPDIGLVSLRFSTVNAGFVRGHAQRYAR